jgi:hypothetical protein
MNSLLPILLLRELRAQTAGSEELGLPWRRR